MQQERCSIRSCGREDLDDHCVAQLHDKGTGKDTANARQVCAWYFNQVVTLETHTAEDLSIVPTWATEVACYCRKCDAVIFPWHASAKYCSSKCKGLAAQERTASSETLKKQRHA